MKRMVLLTILVAAGNAALAQQGAGVVPVAGAAPVSQTSVAASATASTNKPDLAKMQSLYAEFSAINKELRAQEVKLQSEDAELKALMEKKAAAQQVLTEIEAQRRALIDAKVTADPKFAQLVVRRRELQQLLQEMRPPQAAGPRDNPMGPGYKKPPQDGPAHLIVPAPAPAPTVDKPAELPKTK
ncbi:MAG: hypothetical protein ACOYOU_17920 [Kiritimatiellia bacterium]